MWYKTNCQKGHGLPYEWVNDPPTEYEIRNNLIPKTGWVKEADILPISPEELKNMLFPVDGTPKFYLTDDALNLLKENHKAVYGRDTIASTRTVFCGLRNSGPGLGWKSMVGFLLQNCKKLSECLKYKGEVNQPKEI